MSLTTQRSPGVGADRNEELTATHNQIWDLMGLSRPVRHELNAVVLRINTQMSRNRSRMPEEYDRVFKDSKRKEVITHETYVADHLKRWQMLQLSGAAQKELLAAAEFCWTALHDPAASLTAEERQKAEIIRTMMKELGGPPPCCDENIFEKAQA
jgi:hypothetical protein